MTSVITTATLCIFLLCLSVPVLCQRRAEERCSAMMIASCTQHVISFWNNIFEHRDLWSRRYVNRQCRLTDRAVRCIKTFVDDCDARIQIDLMTLESASTFICANIDVYLTHQACINQEIVHRDIDVCNLPWDRSFRNPETVCQSLIGGLKCTWDTLTHHCREDSQAYILMYLYEYRYVEPIATLFECQLQEPPDHPGIETPPRFVVTAQMPGLPQNYPSPTSCQQRVWHDCLEGLEDWYEEFETGNVRLQTDTLLRSECKLASQAFPCIADITTNYAQCQVLDGIYYQGIEREATFVCNEGFDDFVIHQDCLIRNEVRKAVTDCQNLDKAYDIATGSTINVCLDNLENLECIRKEVTQACGQEAGELMYRRKMERNIPLRDYMNCTDGGPQVSASTSSGGTQAGILVGIVLGVVGLIILIVLVLVLVYMMLCRRKNDALNPDDVPAAVFSNAQGVDLGIDNPTYGRQNSNPNIEGRELPQPPPEQKTPIPYFVSDMTGGNDVSFNPDTEKLKCPDYM